LAFYTSNGAGSQTLINQVLGEVKKESNSVKMVSKKMSSGNLISPKRKAAA
jgi:ABC-type molybdenum transport system ATPase subunit/photorepair protein PhrA